MPKTKAKPVVTKIYAVVGSDDVEVKQTAAELADKLKPAEAGDFGLEIIDGAADNADQAAARIRSTIEALRTLPFFGGEKLVWLKNANFLGDDQKARAAAVQRKRPKWSRRGRKSGSFSSMTTRPSSLCFSPAATRARSKMNWKRSISTSAKTAA